MARYIDADLIPFKEVLVPDFGFPDENTVVMVGAKSIGLMARKDEIDAIPTADVAPVRHSFWIQDDDRSGHCYFCGKHLRTNGSDKTGHAIILKALFRYCPNCGAKMDEKETEQ